MGMREYGYMQLGVVGEKLRIVQDGKDVTQQFMGLPLGVKVSQDSQKPVVVVRADMDAAIEKLKAQATEEPADMGTFSNRKGRKYAEIANKDADNA